MKAFKINNRNMKVLYRVALSYFELKEYNKCMDICKISLELENSNIINILYKKCIKCKNDELMKAKKCIVKCF